MKNKSNKKIFGLIALLAVILIVIFALLGRIGGKDDEPETTVPSTQQTTQGNVLGIEDITNAENTDVESTQKVDENMITVVEPEKVTKPKSTEDKTEKETVQQIQPVKPDNGDGPGIVIVGDDDANAYSCGIKRHNCESKETHDFIVSLEKKGCPMCGSNSCKSFYAIDEWGNACYDMTICPKYSVKQDPLEYCSVCGKKIGDGSNGTCVRYIEDTTCEICKSAVKGRTCHSH